MSSAIASTKDRFSHIGNIGLSFKILLISILIIYLFSMLYYANHPNTQVNSSVISPSIGSTTTTAHLSNSTDHSSTNINHILFAILGSEGAWHHRKGYGEAWWRPNVTRGYVYLDAAPTGDLLPWSATSPPFRVSENLDELIKEINPAVPRIIRMVHALLEAFREGDQEEGFRWLVMGDDDTVFLVDNLVDVLAKYDHSDYYYIGCQSNYVKSNMWFSFDMGFGGAGIALSYPLAKALATGMEGCIRRYAYKNTFDIIIMFCIADVGVDLSTQKGLHQVDMHGDISGFLSAHPRTTLLSLHHFDEIEPIFPGMDCPQAVRHLMKAGNADQCRLLQQTICYHRQHKWTISISWGYSIHIYEKIIPRSWLHMPIETFQNWVAPNPDPPHFMFNARPRQIHPCETPHVFFFESVETTAQNPLIGDQMANHSILTSYYRSWPRDLPPCFGTLPADYVSHLHVYSPTTKRTKINRCECCDISYDEGAKNAIVKLRECLSDEILA